MCQEYGPSGQWQKIIDEQLAPRADAPLSELKASPTNYRLSLLDVRTNGVRYLKTLIYNLARNLSAENIAKLLRIENRDVGNPISVTYKDVLVDLDYLRAVVEEQFLADHLELSSSRILEVGAGYGRTCHTLTSLHDIDHYCIIDLPQTLQISQRYLTAVLTEEQLAKVTFIPIDQIDQVEAMPTFDLCINIDSFAEMLADTVRAYLALIDRKATALYVNNPVGKFDDKALDGHGWGEEAVELAMQTGLLTDVLEVHDQRAVEAQSIKYLDAYLPSSQWSLRADAWGEPWSHYWQALYVRTDDVSGNTPHRATTKRASSV